MTDKEILKIRKAKVIDVKGIKNLLDYFSKKELLLPRSLSDLYENIRDFIVAEEDGEIVGCIALHIVWEDLAEVRSLAVKENRQNKKIGTRLLQEAIKEAEKLGVRKIFTLTYSPEFFEKQGFKRTKKNDLPQKIWKDCLNCTHFPDCSEEALLYELLK
ncbi:MAG: N-acetyltransferase [Actinobacteria bacterium]|nr:N-acetyltransferase [Actinomycetota bacterium]